MAKYRELAAEAGLALGEYLALKLAEDHGFEAPAYLREHAQQELPLGA